LVLAGVREGSDDGATLRGDSESVAAGLRVLGRARLGDGPELGVRVNVESFDQSAKILYVSPKTRGFLGGISYAIRWRLSPIPTRRSPRGCLAAAGPVGLGDQVSGMAEVAKPVFAGQGPLF